MNYQEFIQPFYNSETKTSGLRGVQSQGETAEYFVDLAFAHEIPEKYISQPDTYRRWYTGRSNPKSTLWKEIEKAFDDKRFEEYSKELAAKIDDEKLIDLLLAYDIKLALGKKANKKYFAEALTYQFKAIANGKGSADEIVKQTYYSKEKPAVFGEYIRKAKETYSRMTVLGGKECLLDDCYVCNYIGTKRGVFLRNKNGLIIDATLEKLKTFDRRAETKNTLLIANGGMGKSLMLQHLFVDAAEKYSETGLLPIFIELREFSFEQVELFNIIVETVKNMDESFTPEHAHQMLTAGRCQLLLDGVDEIDPQDINSFQRKLSNFLKRYPDNQVVMTSRDCDAYSGIKGFVHLYLLPFDKSQSEELVGRLLIEDDPEAKKTVRECIDDNFIKKDGAFVSNPMMLTFVVERHSTLQNLRAKRYLFYKEAYEAIVLDHDKDKTAYERIFRSVSDSEEFTTVFQEFCAVTFRQGIFSFDSDEYLSIHREEDLIANLRQKLEELNAYKFSDTEWERFFNDCVANKNEGIIEKTAKIQENYVQVLKRDDNMSKNISLIDKKNIHNNRLQVINQYIIGKADGAKYDNRYDVTILVNGLPLVHIELKRRGIAIKEAFNQINRYQRDSFWAGSGLFEYVQIFVISNGTNTKYYSNSTRFNAIKDANATNTKKGKTSNSFEFTSYWSDASNKIIADLVDFTKTFFAKHSILNILTKYCIFTSENMLMVMRPYQITATERILNRIEIAHNYKKYGDIAAGGYIWHTTGSGKTLTSFKAARLASDLPYIDKVLFVVDRKDLDYQTMKEYDRFEKGAANSNSSTKILEKQLRDSKSKIIITTIQKMSFFIKKFKEHPVYNKQVVIIFDECHRSQFGDMHAAIVNSFKKYYMFGFTGTPIFPSNTGSIRNPKFTTTEQTFGDKLHTYTIVNAINDKNVLPFKVEYHKTMEMEPDIDDEQVLDIDRKKAFEDPKRIHLVAQYILDHFDQKTYRGDKTYIFNSLTNIEEVASADRGKVEEIKQKQRLSGFNSIFAVSSVPMAKAYYDELRNIIKNDPTKNLKIAVIYSYGANEEEVDGILDEENPEDTSALDQNSRDFLEAAIQDYNLMFHTNYSTDSDKFQNYYKDVSLRMKNKELDMLIVVNMFLTGFDATTLNTLWVDKNLKMHGLIQAFSRTNRILNSIKTFGNIVCFRNLQKRVDAAISQFGDENAGGIVLMQSFKES